MKLREILTGKKTYLTAASAIISALLAYANGMIDYGALLLAIQGAVTSVFLRSGIKSAADDLRLGGDVQ